MRRRIIAFGPYYHDFMKTLSEKESKKIEYILSLLEREDRMPVKFIKHIKEHGNLYELRMKYESNIYRGDSGLIPGSGRSLEEGMATRSSIFAWRIPWTEEPVGLQSIGSQRSDLTCTHITTYMPCFPQVLKKVLKFTKFFPYTKKNFFFFTFFPVIFSK